MEWAYKCRARSLSFRKYGGGRAYPYLTDAYYYYIIIIFFFMSLSWKKGSICSCKWKKMSKMSLYSGNRLLFRNRVSLDTSKLVDDAIWSDSSWRNDPNCPNRLTFRQFITYKWFRFAPKTRKITRAYSGSTLETDMVSSFK